jgi:hypothetical protein
MNDLEVVKNSLSKPVPFTIKKEDGTEQTVYLKKFTVAQQARGLTLSKKFKVFEEIKGENPEEKMKEMDEKSLKGMEEAMNDAFDLLVSVVKRSIEGIDDETAESFVNDYFEELMEFIEKLTPKSKESSRTDLIKQRMEQRKNENTGNKE